MISLWRNDEAWQLRQRAAHLLRKSYPNLRLVWVVGDCQDRTAELLKRFIAQERPRMDVMVVTGDTGIDGNDIPTRLRRLSETANMALECVGPDDDLVLVHESDIVSPVDLIERMVATGKAPLACWPVLEIAPGARVFYDIWASRKDGRRFTNHPPYHACYRPDAPFEVDSFGTVYMFHAEDVRAGMRAQTRACLDLCAWARQHGRTLWVDPTIVVQQPASLWTPYPVTE